MKLRSIEQKALEEITDILSLPYRRERVMIFHGYVREKNQLQAALLLDGALPRQICIRDVTSQFEAGEFIRLFKRYSLHTDLQVMRS